MAPKKGFIIVPAGSTMLDRQWGKYYFCSNKRPPSAS